MFIMHVFIYHFATSSLILKRISLFALILYIEPLAILWAAFVVEPYDFLFEMLHL